MLRERLESLIERSDERVEQARADGESDSTVEHIEVEKIFLQSELDSFNEELNRLS